VNFYQQFPAPGFARRAAELIVRPENKHEEKSDEDYE
jgi:hypothetical protein